MRWSAAHAVVEDMRRETQLYLPALSQRRGFSSSRVEHLLNRLVAAMPADECYLEVGTLEGRTLEAAAHGNDTKRLIGVDPCIKYGSQPGEFGLNVSFVQTTWQSFLLDRRITRPVGCVFYDGDHSIEETLGFMLTVQKYLADEAVLVLDDWDRETVRAGAFMAHGWQMLRECPEWTDGLTTAPHHFGYGFGVAVFGYRRT